MNSDACFVFIFGFSALGLAFACIAFCSWMRAKGIITWGDLFSYRRRARAKEEALRRGAIDCGCRTGRLWFVAHYHGARHCRSRSVPCALCGGVGAYFVEQPKGSC